MPYVILAKGSPHEGGNMINKVLAIILYISGLFDSKSIVKEVVWRKTTNKGGGVYESKVAIIRRGPLRPRSLPANCPREATTGRASIAKGGRFRSKPKRHRTDRNRDVYARSSVQHGCRPRNHGPNNYSGQFILLTLLDSCVFSLRRGRANILCVVTFLTDDPRRESTADSSYGAHL